VCECNSLERICTLTQTVDTHFYVRSQEMSYVLARDKVLVKATSQEVSGCATGDVECTHAPGAYQNLMSVSVSGIHMALSSYS
jgi:hypothetical protein